MIRAAAGIWWWYVRAPLFPLTSGASHSFPSSARQSGCRSLGRPVIPALLSAAAEWLVRGACVTRRAGVSGATVFRSDARTAASLWRFATPAFLKRRLSRLVQCPMFWRENVQISGAWQPCRPILPPPPFRNSPRCWRQKWPFRSWLLRCSECGRSFTAMLFTSNPCVHVPHAALWKKKKEEGGWVFSK